MAIRYSGNTEVRFGWDRRRKVYRGSVRDPYRRWTGEVSKFTFFSPNTPESYDRAAIFLIQKAQNETGKFDIELEGNKIKIRRVFQSPCPTKMVW